MMKISLFHAPHTHDRAIALQKIAEAQGCECSLHDIQKTFDKEYCQNPLVMLDHASHVVFLYSSQDTDFNAFALLAGYGLGKAKRIIIIETDARFPVPENCKPLAHIMKSEGFEDYLHHERDRFIAEDRRNRARSDLLERGISCFEENFSLIVASGDSEAVSLFLKAGFPATLSDQKGNPLLTIAVRSQYPEIAKLLLDAGADVNRLSGDRAWSPLMDAVQKGDGAMASLLLERGADPNIRSKDGQTALIVCVGRGDTSLCETLVRYGADPSVPDGLGMSAAGYAKLFHNATLMELFNKSPS